MSTDKNRRIEETDSMAESVMLNTQQKEAIVRHDRILVESQCTLAATLAVAVNDVRLLDQNYSKTLGYRYVKPILIGLESTNASANIWSYWTKPF